ncbi:ABC transporter permease subunit [Paenibacillus sp. CMAA1364]
MMNIVLREMKANRRSLIIWCIGIFALIASGMSKYGTIAGSGQSMNEMMSQMPKSLQTLFGMGDFDLSTVLGYFGVLFVYIVLMGTIHAVMLGAGIISKEEQDHTVEFLMAKPVARNTVIHAKLLSAVANIIVLNVVSTISAFLFIRLYSNGESVGRDMVNLMLGLLVLQLIFLCIGAVTASTSRHPKSAPTISAAVLLTAYILSIAASLNGELAFLDYVSPFSYYKADRILSDGGLSMVSIILSIGIMVVSLGITYTSYNKRDLHM